MKKHLMLPLLEQFIIANRRNKRRLKSGKELSIGTKRNYEGLLKLLTEFGEQSNIELRFVPLRSDKALFKREKKYHQTFYIKFTSFLFDDKGHYDNYVGQTIKKLRTFYKWVKTDQGINIGDFHQSFHVWKEDISIIALSTEQLQFLINDLAFEKKLSPSLRRTKDIFVFGCATALRVSDIIELKNENIEFDGTNTYLKVRSRKTNTFTKIKLPTYALEILSRNKCRSKKLIKTVTRRALNSQIKRLAEKAGWDYEYPKFRTRRGVAVVQYKNPKTKTHYRFCDLISTHTMRRSAITTMLNLGVQEQTVRKISGHAPGSVEFYKYVKHNQQLVDQETDLLFKKLQQIS